MDKPSIHVVKMAENDAVNSFYPDSDRLPDGTFGVSGFTSRYGYTAGDLVIIPDWPMNGTRVRGIFRIESIEYYSDPNDQFHMNIRQLQTKGELNAVGLPYATYEQTALKPSGQYPITGD